MLYTAWLTNAPFWFISTGQISMLFIRYIYHHFISYQSVYYQGLKISSRQTKFYNIKQKHDKKVFSWVTRR